MQFKITYKNIKHAIELYNKFKKLDFNYYNISSIKPVKGKLLFSLQKKEHPFCPMRSTYSEVEMNDRHKISCVKYKTASCYEI